MKNIKKALAVAMITATACATMAMGASCKKNKNGATVSFEGVEGTNISNIETQKGEELTLPIPEKEGYRFEGWYTNPEFTGDPVTSLVVDGSCTYYAKWSELCAITLDLGGGSLGTTKIYADAGSNVYDAVKDLVPTKEGLTFGAWFHDGKELTKSVRLPAEGITLTAAYKVEYTVEVWLDNLEGEGYSKDEELTIVGSDYVGAAITPTLDVEGCTQIAMEGQVLSTTLSEQAANNVLKAYFNRNTYTITFNPNLPSGSAEKIVVEAKYGEEVPVPSEYYFVEGYCMLGWSTNATSGEITYAADLDKVLYNKVDVEEDDEEAESASYAVKVERQTVLYGVWQQGMKDAFGGSDYIYYVDGMGETIYLSRADKFFKGKYIAEDNTYEFWNYLVDENGEIVESYVVCEGILLGNGKFVHYSQDRVGSYSLYRADTGLTGKVTLSVDRDISITYTEYDEETGELAKELEGTYALVKDNEYEATFTDENGQTVKMYFMVGTAGETPAFQIRNEEEFAIGELTGAAVFANQHGGYDMQVATVTLKFDGYGTATWTQNGSSSYYGYKKVDDSTYQLLNSNGSEFGVVRLSTDTEGALAKKFFIYNEGLDTTITLENGGTLTLDGVGTATYTKDSTSVTAYYRVTSMPMGGTLVSMVDNKNNYATYKFLLDIEEGGITGKKVLNTYAEYYYKDAQSLYYAPMLVVDKETEGSATLYGYTSNGEYLEVAEGNYVKDGDGNYVFTMVGEGKNYDYVQENPINLSTISSFVFQVGSQSGYSIHYWHSYNNGTAMGDNEDYVEAAGTGTLKLVGGFAFYKATQDMDMVSGAYSKNGDTITFTDGEGKSYSLELKVDGDDKTFIELSYAPYTAYLVGVDNKVDSDCTLKFDGKGGAIYVVDEVETAGTITESGKTAFGDQIYVFTPNDSDDTFTYILNGSYFYQRNDTYAAGEYTIVDSAISGTVTLDGYCYKAKYDGINADGLYYLDGDAIYAKVQGQTYILDKKADGQLTLRGEEYGIYTLFNNQYPSGLYFEMNGYGALTVFSLDANGDRVVKAEDVTYIKAGSVYTFTYAGKNYVCKYDGLSYKAEDDKSYKVLVEKVEGNDYVLVDTESWNVLILDEYGNAVKYDEYGIKQTGRYTRVTETLLYFVNEQGTDACLYNCDLSANMASPIDLEDKNYYTNDLKALNFTRYGFVIIDGDRENMNFYQMDADSNVILYRRPMTDAEEKAANAYGFYTDNTFGKLDNNSKELNGVTYYRSSGAEIKFQRTDKENLALYPVIINKNEWTIKTVSFVPAGSDDFSVTGTVVADVKYSDGTEKKDVPQSCKVVREGNEMYILISGAFRLYIDAEYQGSGKEVVNTFTANKLDFKQELYSYNFLDTYYRLAVIYGASVANSYQDTYGTITLEMVYDEAGEETSNAITAEFKDGMKLVDSQGNKLTSIEKQPYYQTKDGLYYVEVEMPDGYKYRMYFFMSMQQYLNMTGFTVYAFTRVQEFTVTEGEGAPYTVVVEKTVASEMGLELGSVFAIELKNSTTSLGVCAARDGDTLFKVGDQYRYVARTYDKDDKLTSATYYYITLTENNDGSMGDDGETNYATYKSAVVTGYKEATIMREANDENRYAEIVDGEVALLKLYKNIYYVESCTYDEATSTYTVRTTKGTTYTVKVNGEHVLIEQKNN